MSQKNVAIVDESNWRQELEYLDTLLTGRFTESEAKEHAKNELVRHDSIIHTIETEIAQTSAAVASASSFIPPSTQKRIARKVDSLELQLANARKLRERSILQSGGAIRDCKEADKLRPRWLDLRKREQSIQAARNIGKNTERQLLVSMPRKWD
jgi:hypothetical protein